MGKAALLSLVGSIVEAGGASTQQALCALIPSAQEALQSNDWATRKAASEAFCRMPSNIETPLLLPFKSSCMASLESCRFDKKICMRAIYQWVSNLPVLLSPIQYL